MNVILTQLMVEMTGCWLPHASSALRTMGLALLKELLLHQPALFGESNLDATLGLLLAGVGDSSRDVSSLGRGVEGGLALARRVLPLVGCRRQHVVAGYRYAGMGP